MVRNNPGRSVIVTYTSDDDGRTWTRSNALDNPTSSGTHAGLMEAAILELNDGRIWMLIRTNWGYFYESYSSDNGLTWSDYTKTNIDASSAPGALKRLQSGRVVLIWNRYGHSDGSPIRYMGGDFNWTEVVCSWHRDELSMIYSDDDCQTWSKPIIIATAAPAERGGTYGVSYPLISEIQRGWLWVSATGNLRFKIREEDLVQYSETFLRACSGER
jgi:Neuraminidase (sialidase)